TVGLERERCPVCRGRGYSAGYHREQVGLCGRCQGVGKVPTDRQIELKLPAGLRDGTKLRLRGQGPLRWDGTREDLICVVRIDRTWGK
ncbi:MAG: hypothetical protein ACE5K7_05865, partial [Phycisphaerae bacterium]